MHENQIVNLAGMLFPPIGLFLIPHTGIQHSQFLIRLSGLFLTPLSGIILIGARALLFMSVAQTHSSQYSRVNDSHTININKSMKRDNMYLYLIILMML
jgi:hypothetical protein